MGGFSLETLTGAKGVRLNLVLDLRSFDLVVADFQLSESLGVLMHAGSELVVIHCARGRHTR